MAKQNKKYRIFLSAAEPSADSHCAELITALKQTTYDLEFVGVGGPKMAQAGCELLETTTQKAAMLYNAFAQIFRFYKLIKRITRYFKTSNVDLLIVCDSPAFNFHIAKAAKKSNIKTMFYVAPQLWAWAEWRIGKLRKYCDKLCCILPFEQCWFSQKGIDAIFVGNPLLDNLPAEINPKNYSYFDAGNAKIALLAGSRPAEIKTLWPAMQKIALQLKQFFPNAVFTTSAVDSEKQKLMQSLQLADFKCTYTTDSVIAASQSADFAIVASGSATLQVAATGCPMVIMYQSSRILWLLIGRWIVKTKPFSLVNILAEKQLVPEFMPYFSSIKPITKTISHLLQNKTKLSQTSSELIKLTATLKQGKTCEKVAKIATEMLS